MAVIEAIAVGLHLRWRGVWQRPNHVLARLSRRVPVVVLEEPILGEREGEEIAEHDGLTVVTPSRTRIDDTIDANGIATVRRLIGDRRPLVWLYTPQMLPLADGFPGAPIVYDKMDELARFKGADPRVAAREPELLRRAAVAFAGGRTLHASIAGARPDARCYPSGVDVDHFASAERTAPHPALAGAPRPVFSYVGVIDERLDLELIAALAAARPDATIAMVGPLAKIEPASLPSARNLRWLGKRGYDELPGILAATDVALMPFAINEATSHISPTKTLEYLAAGVPVVSTPIADVVAAHRDVVAVADDHASFIAAVAAAERRDPGRRERGRARARAGSWDAIVDGMTRDLVGAGITLPAPVELAG